MLLQDIDEIVNECIKQHEGGQRFFDALDERIRTSDGLLHSMAMMLSLSGIPFSCIITSGKFGAVFKEFLNKEYPDINVVTVDGSLRGDNNISVLQTEKLAHKNNVFVDDSFYSGKTRNKVKAFVESCGGELTATYVFYDGSREKDASVHSMYRYYK